MAVLEDLETGHILPRYSILPGAGCLAPVLGVQCPLPRCESLLLVNQKYSCSAEITGFIFPKLEQLGTKSLLYVDRSVKIAIAYFEVRAMRKGLTAKLW